MITPLNNVTGKPVDWWFAYKLPVDIGPKSDTKGFEFLYVDADSNSEITLSSLPLDHDNSAFGNTLNQVFSGDADAGFVLWNDEIPPSKNIPKPKNNGQKGHSKGIIGFSKKTNSGFYLLHSTPRFPLRGMLALPDYERQYGQTYLCVSLPSFQTANDIAEILLSQHQVQVYDSLLPNVEETEFLWKLANNVEQVTPLKPANYDFKTQKGVKFKFLAKNRAWSKRSKADDIGKDFWEDLVAPSLSCDLTVETWRRGLVFEDADNLSKEITQDILRMDLSQIGLNGYQWPFTKDHAKWGVSDDSKNAYIIIADINRQVSQRNRGGGGLAFQNADLWKALRAMERAEKSIEKTIHKDQI